MAKSEHLGLELTESGSTPFENWRKTVNGNESSNAPSNAQIMDRFAGTLADGTENQYLRKSSGTDFDYTWESADDTPTEGSDKLLSSKGALLAINGAKSAVLGVSGVVTLSSSGWTAGQYTLTVSQLGDDDAIFFSPVGLADKENLEKASVIISATGTTVTFTAQTVPTQDIGLNFFITRGQANG